jgi:hypothetical protein
MAFKVGTLEAGSPHLLADLIELIAVLHVDGRAAYRPDDIVSVIEGQPDFSDNEPRDLRASVQDAWSQLGYRAGKFDLAYPFTVKGGELRLRPSLSPENRLYRLLLVCSRLRSFERKLRVAWAADFTRLSREVLVQLMPSWANVRIFDANSEDRKSYFGTDLREALIRLGQDLAASMVKDAECQAQGPSGDAGIDLVAIAGWEDPASGIHAILGQCAARETEWPTKRLQAHAVNFRGMYSFLTDPVNAVFVPVLFRDTNGRWITDTDASGCLLIDRLRFILLLRRRGRLDQLVTETWFKNFEKKFDGMARRIVPAAA